MPTDPLRRLERGACLFSASVQWSCVQMGHGLSIGLWGHRMHLLPRACALRVQQASLLPESCGGGTQNTKGVIWGPGQHPAQRKYAQYELRFSGVGAPFVYALAYRLTCFKVVGSQAEAKWEESSSHLEPPRWKEDSHPFGSTHPLLP